MFPFFVKINHMLFGVTIHNCISNSAVMNIDNPLISDEFLINQLDLIIDEVILLNALKLESKCLNVLVNFYNINVM